MLVSALIADGPPSRLIEEAVDGYIELLVPTLVLRELEHVLKSKLGFTAERWSETEQFLTELAIEELATPEHTEHVTGHFADDCILACAAHSQVDVLVTGDRKHMLPLTEHCGVRIVAPQTLLAELNKPG